MLISKLISLINNVTWTWYFPVFIFVVYVFFTKKIKKPLIIYLSLSILLSINIFKFDNALSNFELIKYKQSDFRISSIFVNNQYFGMEYFIDDLGYLNKEQNTLKINVDTISDYKNKPDFEWNLPDKRFLYTLNYLFREYLAKNGCNERNYIIEIENNNFRYCI